MTRPRPAAAPGRLGRDGVVRPLPAVVVTVLTLSVGILALVSASRPARLTGASPGNLDRLGAPPASVTLTFNARPDGGLSHVAVVDPAGGDATRAGHRVTGTTVVQPVSIAGTGTYRVVYHAVFADGRDDLTGHLAFTVAGPPAPASDRGRSASDGSATVPGAGAAAGGRHAGHGMVDPVTGGLLALDAAVLVGALGYAAYRWRRLRSNITI